MSPKENEILLLTNLINEMTERLDKLKNSNEEEYFLSRELKSFPDFPNIKEGNLWDFAASRLEIYTLNDLIHSYPEELKRIRGIGDGRINEIRKWLKKYNLDFLGVKDINKRKQQNRDIPDDERAYYENLGRKIEEFFHENRIKTIEDYEEELFLNKETFLG